MNLCDSLIIFKGNLERDKH